MLSFTPDPYSDGYIAWGFEPYFKKKVSVGVISDKGVYHAHGYYPPHKYGKKLKEIAKKFGIENLHRYGNQEENQKNREEIHKKDFEKDQKNRQKRVQTMKTALKIALLAVALVVMNGCSAQRRAQKHMRKAVELCPELVQVKAHAVDTVLTVKPWADVTTMQLTQLMSGDTIYKATDHGTFVVSHNRQSGEVRIGFLAAPQKLHYRDTLKYEQVVVPSSFGTKTGGGFWSSMALWLLGILIGTAIAVWLMLAIRRK